ncbi:glycoside hydrolase family 28 protein [Bombilactobacillus bombi]|uniref:glycoside hydrolase family 28 protein n=1 Tax=Bombilactobacillus bombi TaxID=1303590 RepID=UPI0038F69A61
MKNNSTEVIQDSIDKCNNSGGGEVIIPEGDYIIDGLILRSNVTLNLKKGCHLIGSGNEDNYILRKGPFELNKNNTPISGLIFAKNQTNISIIGEGTIDGNYRKFIYPNQDEELHLKFYKYPRPMIIYFENSSNILLKNFKIKGAPFWTVHLVGCLNTEIYNIDINNEMRMPNTDGFDIDRSKNTYIHNCNIITGDDAICPKCTEETSKYGDCSGLVVNNCKIKTESSAVKFGSSSFGNFVNCKFTNLTIKDTNRGLTFQLRDPGNAENILFENIKITTKHYSEDWWGSGEPIFISILPRSIETDMTNHYINNVIFRNIECYAENGIFIGSENDNMINNLLFSNIKLNLMKKTHSKIMFDLRPWKGVDKIEIDNLDAINVMNKNDYIIDGLKFHYNKID